MAAAPATLLPGDSATACLGGRPCSVGGHGARGVRGEVGLWDFRGPCVEEARVCGRGADGQSRGRESRPLAIREAQSSHTLLTSGLSVSEPVETPAQPPSVDRGPGWRQPRVGTEGAVQVRGMGWRAAQPGSAEGLKCPLPAEPDSAGARLPGAADFPTTGNRDTEAPEWWAGSQAGGPPKGSGASRSGAVCRMEPRGRGTAQTWPALGLAPGLPLWTDLGRELVPAPG